MTFPLHPSADLVLESEEPANAKAYQALLDAIISEAVAPGELISEGQVAEEIGMSRTPIREAFLRLRTEGLLELYPRRGAVVSAPRPDEGRDLVRTTAMFEESAVRRLAETGVPPELGPQLDDHLKAQKRMSDPLEFVRSDFAFHHMIVAAGGNRFATALFNQTGPRLLRYWFGIARAREARERIVTENAALADVVVAADLDGYKALLQSHPELARGAFGVTINS